MAETFIILMRTKTGKLTSITEDTWSIKEFPTYQDAYNVAEKLAKANIAYYIERVDLANG